MHPVILSEFQALSYTSLSIWLNQQKEEQSGQRHRLVNIQNTGLKVINLNYKKKTSIKFIFEDFHMYKLPLLLLFKETIKHANKNIYPILSTTWLLKCAEFI